MMGVKGAGGRVDIDVTSGANWTLTGEGLQQLLDRLGPDDASAGAAYEALRERLADFFDWRGLRLPEAAADATLDRVARRLSQGADVGHLRGFVYGVARHVLQERLRAQIREQQAVETWTASAIASRSSSSAERERPVACLMRCLRALPAAEQELIAAYYGPDGSPYGVDHRGLAARLGLSAGGLRTRAHRLRVRLEACLQQCLRTGEEDR